MADEEPYQDWLDLEVYGSDGERIGEIADLFDDDEGAQDQQGPAMATVKIGSGVLGPHVTYLPLRGVARREGDRITVPFTKDQVETGPNIAEDDELTETEARGIYRYYGLDETGGPVSDTPRVAAPAVPRQWTKVIKRRVTVSVVDDIDDVDQLVAALPPEVSVADVKAAAAAADGPAVIFVRERQVEELRPAGLDAADPSGQD